MVIALVIALLFVSLCQRLPVLNDGLPIFSLTSLNPQVFDCGVECVLISGILFNQTLDYAVIYVGWSSISALTSLMICLDGISYNNTYEYLQF